MRSVERKKVIFNFIRLHPGCTGREIRDELVRRSRATKLFGADSWLAQILGPNLIDTRMALRELLETGVIKGNYGERLASRGWRRQVHYFAAANLGTCVYDQEPAQQSGTLSGIKARELR